MMSRALRLLAAGFGALALAPPAGFAATPQTPYEPLRIASFDPQPFGRFADRMKSAGDLNSDGVCDVWVGVYGQNIGALNDAGRVYAVSGRDRSPLYSVDSPEPQSCTSTMLVPFCGFGWSLTNLGDIDGDGINDFAAGSVRHDVHTGTGPPCGAPEPNGCNEGQGKAWVFSGAPGKPRAPLYALDNPVPQAGGAFGWSSTAGDIVTANGSPGGDGISEVLVGAFQNDSSASSGIGCGDQQPAAPSGCRKDEGQAFIFNVAPGGGAQARLVRTLNIPAGDRYVDASNRCISNRHDPVNQICGGFGIVAEGTGDTNGDGVSDQLVTAWTIGVTLDGQACLGANPEVDDNCNEHQGRMYLFSGANGALLHRFDDPVPQYFALFGLQIVEAGAPGDVNGDGFADIYGTGFLQNGPSRAGQPPLPLEGLAWVFNGKTGERLYALEDPTPQPFGSFGHSLAKTDYDRDGRPDLYVGSLGGTYVFKGANGELMKVLDPPPSDLEGQSTPGHTNFGRSVAAPGDLNGDCEPDFFAGSPALNVGSNEDEGRLYAFMSSGSADCPRPAPPVPDPEPQPAPVPPPQAPPGPRRDDQRPEISEARAFPGTFEIGSLLPRLARASRVGTTIRLRLSEPATLRLRFARARPGRRVGGSCRRPTRGLRGRRLCTRFVTVPPAVVVGGARAGRNSVRFAGRLTRRRTLRPGRHRLTLTATDAAGNRSRATRVGLRLTRRRGSR